MRERDEPAFVEPRARGLRDAAAFVRERRERDTPTAAGRADAIAVGDAHAVEEHLGEVPIAVHLAQRADVDAGSAQIEPERGDPCVLGYVGIAAREKEPPLRVVAAARPDLLAVDDPLVAVARRARREAREVGARVGLGEELAPDLGAGADAREPARALFGGAVLEEGRADEREADQEGVEVGDREAAELLGDGRDPRAVESHPAVLQRPGRDRPAAVGEGTQVRAPGFEVVAPCAEHRSRGFRAGTRCEPHRQRRPHLRPERRFAHGSGPGFPF